jgi:hypothetical protein
MCCYGEGRLPPDLLHTFSVAQRQALAVLASTAFMHIRSLQAHMRTVWAKGLLGCFLQSLQVARQGSRNILSIWHPVHAITK